MAVSTARQPNVIAKELTTHNTRTSHPGLSIEWGNKVITCIVFFFYLNTSFCLVLFEHIFLSCFTWTHLFVLFRCVYFFTLFKHILLFYLNTFSISFINLFFLFCLYVRLFYFNYTYSRMGSLTVLP